MEFVGSPDSVCSEPPRPSSTELPNTGSNLIGFNMTRTDICNGCKQIIRDRWMLHVGKQGFHMSCLRCSVCLRTLDTHKSCYIRNNQVFCKSHYLRVHATQCQGCGDGILPSDWIRRARDLVYHVNCFRCHICQRQLATGDTCVVKGDVTLCVDHGDVVLPNDDGDNMSVSSVDSDSRIPEGHDEKIRRSRASFSTDHLRILQEAFMHNPVPIAEDMDRLAAQIGFPRKVVMIWFQNARARNKRVVQAGMMGHGGFNRQYRNPGSPASPASPAAHPILID